MPYHTDMVPFSHSPTFSHYHISFILFTYNYLLPPFQLLICHSLFLFCFYFFRTRHLILLTPVAKEETMLKQSTNRNQKTKGFKVKLSYKIFILIAVGIWLLYQLNSSHEKKSYEESSAKVFEDLKDDPETKKLGRKGLQPWTDYKPFELMDDTKENEHEREDDVVIHDGDKVEEEESEEVEDLTDEQDKEKEEKNEDEDVEDMGKHMEGMSLLEDDGRDDEGEGGEDTHATSEKHNKENGASRAVMRETKSLGSEFEFGGLRKVKEEEVGNSKRVRTDKQKKKILDTSNSSTKVVDSVTVEHGSYPNVLLTKGIYDLLDFRARSNSDSLLKTEI